MSEPSYKSKSAQARTTNEEFRAGHVALFGEAVHQLWNLLVPSIFGLPVIGFWQAVGLLVLGLVLGLRPVAGEDVTLAILVVGEGKVPAAEARERMLGLADRLSDPAGPPVTPRARPVPSAQPSVAVGAAGVVPHR